MKVGLFGDRYACLTLEKGTAWFEDKELLNNYQFDNYGKKGSDISWSYKLFLENNLKYKKNIFIVTESTRHSFKIGQHTFHVSNLDTLDYIQNQFNDFKIKKILSSLKDHYLYTMPIDLYDFGVIGMINHIKTIRPDTIIVYGFVNSKMTNVNFCLSQVSLMELKQFDIDFAWMKKVGLGEGRSAHMTDQNNKIFADFIKNKLDGRNVNISISDFYVPSKDEVKKYFPDL